MCPAGTDLVFNVQDKKVFNVSNPGSLPLIFNGCRDMQNRSMYAGVQCTLVFNLTDSTVCTYVFMYVQYRYLIAAPVDRTSPSAWLYKHPWITSQQNKPSTPMTHAACESLLRSVVRSGTCGKILKIHRHLVGYPRRNQ